MIGSQLQSEGIDKISLKTNVTHIIAVEEFDYYVISANSNLILTVEIKSLKQKDANKNVNELNLNLPIVIK